VLRAVGLTQYRRVTNGQTVGWTDGRTNRQIDRQTDGVAVDSTALAMRALRRAVKSEPTDMHIHQDTIITILRTGKVNIIENDTHTSHVKHTTNRSFTSADRN